ncbi:hypothetical protein SPWS13_1365 [Shewanella putrefaciens]|nr:hypothetical protein SPWS13_1365 [Shewanella putrefaciens]
MPSQEAQLFTGLTLTSKAVASPITTAYKLTKKPSNVCLRLKPTDK